MRLVSGFSLAVAVVLIGCDSSRPAAIVTDSTPREPALTPTHAEIAVGESITYQTRASWVSGGFTYTVTNPAVVRIHPDSGRATGLTPGLVTVISTSRNDPAIRSGATLQVRPR